MRRREPIGALEALARVDEVGGVLLSPSRKSTHRFEQRHPEIGQGVLGSRRRGPQCPLVDQAVGFELVQGLSEHLLADATDPGLQVGVPGRPAAEGDDNGHRPRVGDQLECRSGGAVLHEDVVGNHPCRVGR